MSLGWRHGRVPMYHPRRQRSRWGGQCCSAIPQATVHGGIDASPVKDDEPSDTRPRVLNVGGGSKAIPIPAHYAGWNHLLLDIDPRGNPDVLCDARELDSLEANQFDAIYCSHNLEHYYKHDGADVLKGFIHVLKPDGFAEIRVPDLKVVMRTFVERTWKSKIFSTCLPAVRSPIRDVIYGWGVEIERSGDDFYAHKTGFTPLSLTSASRRPGFKPYSSSRTRKRSRFARWRSRPSPRTNSGRCSDCPSVALSGT